MPGRTAHLVCTAAAKDMNTDPGRVSYVGEDALFTNFSITAPGVLMFLQIPPCLSCCPVSCVPYGN